MKDGVNARLDLAELGVKPELFAIKEIILQELDKMKAELVVTLCLLEKFFPPSFFDIMLHLIVHLTREVERKLAISKETVSETVRWISYGLRATEVKYDAYNINGYPFRMKCHDGKVYQNSGVSVEAIDLHISKEVATTRQAFYYVVLQEIWKPPKNYKDTYDEVDKGFSTVIHQPNDNILPRVNQRDLGNESRDDYYRTYYGDSSSENNNSDSYSTSQISTSEEIDYDSSKPPKSLLKWYHHLSDEYKDNDRFWGSKSGCNESDVKPSWKDIEKAKACMLAKAQASEASSKAKVEACGSKVKVKACGSNAKLQASTKTLIVKSSIPITNYVFELANAKT
nr:hypothetical protein [Tanacetum cinerariifolium]